MGVLSQLPSGGLSTFESLEEKIPLLGICFGHQIIAQALGGKVEKFSGGWSVGLKEYKWGKESIHLNAWHQDQVVKKPKKAEVLAENSFCKFAALSYGETILTVQPHPEFTHEVIKGLIETRGKGRVPEQLLDEALNNFEKKTIWYRKSQQLHLECNTFFMRNFKIIMD